MKKRLDYSSQILYKNMFAGIAFVAIGIFELLNGLVFQVLAIVGLLIGIFCLLRTWVGNQEEADEMAVANLRRAKEVVMHYAQVLVCAISLVSLTILRTKTVSFDCSKVIPAVCWIILGMINLGIAIAFKKYEEE